VALTGAPRVWLWRVARVAAGADHIFLQAECPWPEFDEQMTRIRAEILDRRDDIFARAAVIAGG
jgi:hypothetical protein